MTSLKRAALSLLYYWRTGVLLIVLFTVIATLLLSGISVKNAAQKQTASIRRTLGGNVVLSAVLNDEGQIKTPLTFKQVSEAAKLPHVKSSNFVVTYTAKPVSLSPVGSMELCGQSDSAMQEEFAQKLAVIEGGGRGLGEKDLSTANALVSDAFAKQNKLKLGDKVSFALDINGKTLSFTIVGIFADVSAEAQDSNVVYVPYTALRGAVGRDEFFHAEYMMDDPMNIESFRESVLKLGLGIGASQINAQDTVYEELSGPINSLSYIAAAMVYIMLAAGAIIFSLILLLNLRGRKYEIGVLLSIGEKKLKIIGQLAAEALVPIVIAFTLSVGTGKLAAQGIGNLMFASQMQPDTVEVEGQSYTTTRDIAVKVTPQETGLLYISGLVITLVSAAAVSVSIMRYRPREILTQDE